MPDITPKPTKGSGILKFSEDAYLEFKYDYEEDILGGIFHFGENEINLVPEVIG